MRKLEWNVYITDFNSKEVIKYNVFSHYYFNKDCGKAWSEYCKNNNKFIGAALAKAKFAEDVKKYLAYYFWSKYEWEIVITCFPEHDKFTDKKVDVYEQIMLNWEQFINYMWDSYNSGVRK